jgi:hypothetical protein
MREKVEAFAGVSEANAERESAAEILSPGEGSPRRYHA